jgi:hypothetical protein
MKPDEENCLTLLNTYFDTSTSAWRAVLLKTLSAQESWLSTDESPLPPPAEDLTVLMLRPGETLLIWKLFPNSLLEDPSEEFLEALTVLIMKKIPA